MSGNREELSLNSDQDFEQSMDVLRSADSTVNNEILIDDNMNVEGYVVVCDTSYNYSDLLRLMLNLSKRTNIKIDTLGRFYNYKSNKLQLPDDASDEIYAGEYYPRRDFDTYYSIEYASQFIDGVDDSLLVLVSGIYNKEEEAKSMLKQMEPLDKKAYISKSSIYMGCMH